MAEEKTQKRQRSAINALKLVNQLRGEKGLPRVSTKPKVVRLTPELKKEVARQELMRLIPEALTESHFEFSEDQSKQLVHAVEARLARIKAGLDQGPLVESAAPRKSRGRPRKS